MGEAAWVKLSAATFDDEKIELIEGMPEGDAIALIWIKLICLARRTNDRGLIYITETVPYNEELLAVKFHKPVGTVRLAVETFTRLKMIEILQDGKIYLRNWAKYQFLEGLEKVREQARVRMARYRRDVRKRIGRTDTDSKRKGVTHGDVTVTSPRDADVTHCNAHRVENSERDIRESRESAAEAAARTESETKSATEKHEVASGVWLTDAEHEELKARYSETETETMIRELSNALGNTVSANKYKSHFKTLCNWIDRDRRKRGWKPPASTKPKVKICPECKKRYFGSACVCGWGEQELGGVNGS